MVAIREAVCACIVAFASAGAGAATWSLPHSGTADGAVARSLNAFTEALPSKAKLSLAPEAERDPTRLVKEVRAGDTPAAALPLAALTQGEGLVDMDQVPFLAVTFTDARKLWQVVRPQVETALSTQGLVLLYALPQAPRALLATRAIKRVEDFKGLRVVMDGPRLASFVTRTHARKSGAAPRSKAMSSGQAEIAFASATDAVRDEAWSYSRYYLHAPAWFPKYLVVVNRNALIALPRASRDALLSAADNERERAWRLAEQETDARLQNLRDRGVKVRRPSVDLLIALEDLGRELLFDWSDAAGEAGAEMVEQYYRIK